MAQGRNTTDETMRPTTGNTKRLGFADRMQRANLPCMTLQPWRDRPILIRFKT